MTSALRNSLASKMIQPSPQSDAASISAPTTAIHDRTNAWRKPGDDQRRGAGNDHLPEQRALAGAHRLGGAQPQRIDRAHAGPGVEQHRKQRGVEHDRHRHRIAEAEPQDEHRHPGERGDRHQRARERHHEILDGAAARHRDAERQAAARPRARSPTARGRACRPRASAASRRRGGRTARARRRAASAAAPPENSRSGRRPRRRARARRACPRARRILRHRSARAVTSACPSAPG